MYFRFGTLWDARIFVHWNVILVFPAGLLLTDFAPWPWLQFVCSYFLLLFLHELGHLVFAKRANMRRVALVISAFGGGCVAEEPKDFVDAVLIDLGGVIFQAAVFVLAVLYAALAGNALVAPVEPALLVFIYVNAIGILGSLYPAAEIFGPAGQSLPSDGMRILNRVRKQRERSRSFN